MDRFQRTEPPQIGAPLDSLRAAIDVVAAGQATRVTVQAPRARSLLPAARQLARRAAVRVEVVEPGDADSELTVVPIAASGR